MLTTQDIYDLKINPINRNICLPPYANASRASRKYAEVGADILLQLLETSESELIEMSRNGNDIKLPYVARTLDNRMIGIVPSVSMVHNADLLSKHIVIPNTNIVKNSNVDDTYTLGIFVTGTKWGDDVDLSTTAKVIGWVNSSDIIHNLFNEIPEKFLSKLPKLGFVPCNEARTVDEFKEEFIDI